MNTKSIDAIAKAVLYEGYMLYPYRASSVKNRQRFNFGVLYPRSYSGAQAGSDAWTMQSECLVRGSSLTAIEVKARFLKLVARVLTAPIAGQEANSETAFEPVGQLEVDGRVLVPWQEAVECEVTVPACNLAALATAPLEWMFSFPAVKKNEDAYDAKGRIAGRISRNQEDICGVVEIQAAPATDGISKLQVKLKNLTAGGGSAAPARDQALMHSLVSAHLLMGVIDGQFVSLLEPPEDLKDFAAGCQNFGTWPVLVGAEGESDTMLASPVILYDYPQIAPESPGDLFDGTEIDEILALRILTMTEDEKREMSHTDERARKILERTESLPMEHLMKLHGTLRELRTFKEKLS